LYLSKSQPTLPSHRAFVVQFRAQSPEASLAWEGQTEHVASGQVARFHSPEELLMFLSRMPTEAHELPCGGRPIDAAGCCKTPVGNTVDVANATSIGASELITVWQNPNFERQASPA
jgi:hypothetical protein